MLVAALTFLLVFSLSQSLPIRQYKDFNDLRRYGHRTDCSFGWWCKEISREGLGGGETINENQSDGEYYGERLHGDAEERRNRGELAEVEETRGAEYDGPVPDLREDEGREEVAAAGSDETAEAKGYDAAGSRRFFSDILSMGAAVTKHAVLGTAEVLNPFKMTSSLNTTLGEEAYRSALQFWKRIPMPQPVTMKLSQITKVMADRLVYALADAGVIMYDYLPSMTSVGGHSDTEPQSEEAGTSGGATLRGLWGHLSESALQGIISTPMHFIGGTLEIINPFKLTSDFPSKLGRKTQLGTQRLLSRVPLVPGVLKKKLSQISAVIVDRIVATTSSVAKPLLEASNVSGLTQAVADVAIPRYIEKKMNNFLG